MREFFYSAFIFRNGQNAIPSILLQRAEWTECCEWKSKMADGEISDADSNAPLPDLLEKKMKIHFWMTLRFISTSTRRFSVRGVFPSRKTQFGKWLPRTWKKKNEQQTARTGRSALFLRSGSAKTTTTTTEWPPYLLRNVYSYQAIRIIPSILYQPFLFQNCE